MADDCATRARCQASLWRAGAAAHLFIFPLRRRKSRLNCGNDETELRTIQFSFFPNGVTLIPKLDRADARAAERAPRQAGDMLREKRITAFTVHADRRECWWLCGFWEFLGNERAWLRLTSRGSEIIFVRW
jgi:hypothetical protein